MKIREQTNVVEPQQVNEKVKQDRAYSEGVGDKLY